MARKTTDTLAPGARVRAKPGTTAPEMPDVPIEGWTGTVTELSGPKAKPRFIIEWDDETIARIPESFRAACEQKGLLFSMACLDEAVLETA